MRARARRPLYEPLAEWERDLLEGEKKAEEAAPAAAEGEKPTEAPAAEAPQAEAEPKAEQA